MRKQPRLWLSLACIIVLTAIYFEPTHYVRGWLWREAFFEGRPTSYWRAVVDEDLRQDPRVLLGRYPPVPSYLERLVHGIGYQPARNQSMRLLADPEAEPVLCALENDANPNIAAFAADARGEGSNDALRWMLLISKHNLTRPEP